MQFKIKKIVDIIINNYHNNYLKNDYKSVLHAILYICNSTENNLFTNQ